MLRRSLLAMAAMTAITIGACGNDAGGDAATIDTLGGAAVPATIDTPGAPVTVDSGATAAPLAESEVERQILEKFDVMGGMDRVTVEADGNGGVVIEGTVKAPDRKQTAEDVARAVPGITRVENRVVVEE